MKIPLRYKMNMGVLNQEDLVKLNHLDVIIIGLGGLGGHVANQLVRLGVKHLTLIDFDRFSKSNLNRQLFSTVNNIGQYKADVIAEEIKKIDPEVSIKIFKKKIQDIEQFSGDYIIDCVDNKETKIYLSQLSKQKNIPLLHGACGGWYGQVGWMSPQSRLIEDLYNNDDLGIETDMLNPPFTPYVVASLMVSEFLKMVQGNSNLVLDELLLIDLLELVVMRSGGKKHG